MTMNLKVLEWFGVITAIAYSLFVASNVGLEFLGFVLLFVLAFFLHFSTWRLAAPSFFLRVGQSLLITPFSQATDIA